jgi:hypothetical protein
MKMNPLLKGIYKDITKNRRTIVEHHRNSETGLITNILGKEQPQKKVGKKNKLGSELSHIQFGVECAIMLIVNGIIKDKMKILIYDGWVSEQVNISEIEGKVKIQLGLDIKFDEELILPPSLDDLMRLKSPKKKNHWKEDKKSA